MEFDENFARNLMAQAMAHEIAIKLLLAHSPGALTAVKGVLEKFDDSAVFVAATDAQLALLRKHLQTLVYPSS